MSSGRRRNLSRGRVDEGEDEVSRACTAYGSAKKLTSPDYG